MSATKRFNLKMTSVLADGTGGGGKIVKTLAPHASPRRTHTHKNNNNYLARQSIEPSSFDEEEATPFLNRNQNSLTSIIAKNLRRPIICGLLLSLLGYFIVMIPIIQTLRIKNDFQLAYTQSFGYFNDISSSDWKIAQQRARQQENHYDMEDPDHWTDTPHAWYQNNWEPNFSCMHERRVGGMGDGPKWVCDPHRIPERTIERVKDGGKPCLIYSVGSQGNFVFEEGLQKEIGEDTCEIHIFDPAENEGELPKGVTYHAWGLESSSELNMESNFKSFQEVVASLGHQGRTVDIFKIDCEGCEWRTFQDWFETDINLMQILVEVHFSPANANNFFDTIQENGYVTFHKEPNTIFGGGNCQEYAFLKLDQSFQI